MIKLSARKGRIKIRLQAIFMGKDLCILIDGGDKPHIGAVTLAYEKNNLNPNTLIIPHHKEDIISQDVSKIVSNAMNCAVCCICGIHINNITKDEILQVLDMARALSVALIDKLNDKTTPNPQT